MCLNVLKILSQCLMVLKISLTSFTQTLYFSFPYLDFQAKYELDMFFTSFIIFTHLLTELFLQLDNIYSFLSFSHHLFKIRHIR